MKHLIELVLLPSGCIALLLFVAGVLYFVFRRRRAAGIAIAVAASIYLFFANGLTAFWLMGHLEHESEPDQNIEALATTPETLVVLTGYALADARVPITGQVNSASGLRLLEASRIFARRRMPVIISGSAEVTAIMRDLLVQLGIPPASIILEQESNNTYESAAHLRDRLAGKRFYLVTSAGHMPRAIRAFRKQGLLAIPAPTDYLSSRSWRVVDIVPSGRHLAISDLAIHEYLGLLWYRLLERI